MIKKHQRLFNIMQVSLDALSLLVAYTGAIVFKLNITGFAGFGFVYYWGALWMVPLLLVVYHFMDVYSPMRSRMYRKEVLMIVRAHFMGIVTIYSVLFLNKDIQYSREVSLLFALSGLCLILVERYFVRKTLRYLRKKGYNQKHLLIVGAGPVGVEFAHKVNAHRDFGYNVIGFLDDDESKQQGKVVGKPVMGCCSLLPRLLENRSIDEVVVALPLNAYGKYGGIVDGCEKAGVRVRIIPDYNKYLPGSPVIEEFDGIPLLNIRKIPLDDPFNRFVKRTFDLAVSSLALLITSPVMIVIAAGIKLTSPGPVFFRQSRIGLNNRPFDMLKFRSMCVADDARAATTWTTPNDPRKTQFGSFLRKTSLDELPQFFNVFTGSMSVVGPRPERPFFVEQFREDVPKYMVKHQVKPGITGWAQVNGWRGDTSIEKRIECDIYYIENWDLLFDVKIMFLTVFRGLINKNAY
ncbi:undecaprenyl-phosphate glucose phosphotransferase [Geomobilimonas luticola]|uniref:Undecaprenyl-phosphate glucose phosphotransferase n=1 Tax=Geomobilimonas luticola TaxID=1114878 RepID=A0ABS5SG56_9BACT|nr:undecaprenyl-phosphate glucose phosphotransferase [Geomobilimonas luticola]MBT0654200.1 undecaprenyl-phosphate glucose phosphotransferase [Geomobilimonas luticola]